MSEKSIDDALIEQVIKGDRESFDILVKKYQSRITILINRIIEDPTQSADIAQEVFIKAYRSLDKFRGDSAFYTWLYRIAINTAKNYLKSNKSQKSETDVDFNNTDELPAKIRIRDYSTPETWLCSDELQQALLDAVNTLPEELRSCIILRELAGLSYEEIAQVMQCPVGTVRSRIFRARSVVEQHIKPLM